MNKQLYRSIIISTISLLFWSCTSSPEINGFDSETWKSDRNACKDERAPYSEVLMKNQESILGQTERSVLSLLGRPDKNELYRRQQKFYIYYLEPGPACDQVEAKADSAGYLSIRFNATGVVNEVFLYNDDN